MSQIQGRLAALESQSLVANIVGIVCKVEGTIENALIGEVDFPWNRR